MKKSMGRKMKIEISVGEGRPTKRNLSAKLFSELGVISRNFLPLSNRWKELIREDRDFPLVHNWND